MMKFPFWGDEIVINANMWTQYQQICCLIMALRRGIPLFSFVFLLFSKIPEGGLEEEDLTPPNFVR